MRLVFFGSGAFGLPTLEFLVARPDQYEIALVVSQPDKPAGRQRRLTPTPVAEWAAAHALECIKPERVNEPEMVERIRSLDADAFVVIAFGQKIGTGLLAPVESAASPVESAASQSLGHGLGRPLAINLHGSLLPAYRGAAPIQRAMMDGCTTTGVSIITLAQRMDAGDILTTESTAIRSDETAGELHDRLALLGPGAMARVLNEYRAGALRPQAQDESRATQAAKLTKAEGTTRFDRPAASVRASIHGLNPWPGCTVRLDGAAVRLVRVRDWPDERHRAEPGTILDSLHIACSPGGIEIVEIQPEGGRPMSLAAYCNGREWKPNMQITPQQAEA